MSFSQIAQYFLLKCKRSLILLRVNLLLFAFAALPADAAAAYRFVEDSYFHPWNAVPGRDGKFYGNVTAAMTPGGYAYSIAPTGKIRRYGHFPILREPYLPASAGSKPEGKLGAGQDGSLYGRTMGGGAFGGGVLFRLKPSGEFKIIHHLESPGAEGWGLREWNPGAVLATEAGEIFAGAQRNGVLRMSKDGAYSTIGLPETVISLVETASHEIIAGSVMPFNLYAPWEQWEPNGKLWRLNEGGEFEVLADVGYNPHTLLPLSNGDVLCLTKDRLLQVNAQGEIVVLHEFTLPFQGITPTAVAIANDGSYIGTTKEGGLEGGGVIFRFIPGLNSYSVVQHLPNSGQESLSNDLWLSHFFPKLVNLAGRNNPPMARDDIVNATALKGVDGGPPQIVVPVLTNDRDVDRDQLSIIDISQPSHGVATLDFVAQKVTYQANSTTVENDSFTYKVVDGSGGSAIGHVIIRTNPEGHYLALLDTAEYSDLSTLPGDTFSIRVKGDRTFNARLVLRGWIYRFRGRFNEFNQAAAVARAAPRKGEEPIQLRLRPDGSSWAVEASMRGSPNVKVTCIPQ